MSDLRGDFYTAKKIQFHAISFMDHGCWDVCVGYLIL